MSNKDLAREFKKTIQELTDDKEELQKKISAKESRIKQILIQLENATDDVSHCGKKIRQQEDEIKSLTLELDEFKRKEIISMDVKTLIYKNVID